MPAYPGIQSGVPGIAIAGDEGFKNMAQAINQFMITCFQRQAFQFIQSVKDFRTCFVMRRSCWKRVCVRFGPAEHACF